jgi:hypothetical protein
LTKFLKNVIIIIVKILKKILKIFLKNFEKTLDKEFKVWYNKDTKRKGE